MAENEELGILKLKIEGDDKGLQDTLKQTEKTVSNHEKKVNALMKKGYTKQAAEFRIALKDREKQIKKDRQSELFTIQNAEKQKIISARQAQKARLKIERETGQQLQALYKGKAYKPPDITGNLIKAAAGGAALTGLISKFTSLAKEADIANNRITAMSSIVKSKLGEEAVGTATKLLDELTETGLFERDLAAEAIKNMTAWGASIEQTSEFLRGQLDLAVKNRDGNYGLGESIVTVTRGLKNNISTLTDATGVSENLSVIIGKAKKQYEEENKVFGENAERLAILNEFNKQASVFTGDAAKAQEQFTGVMSTFNNEVSKVTISLGTQIGDALKPFLKVITDMVKAFGDWFTNLAPLSKQILIFASVLVPLIPTVWGLVAALKAMAVASGFALGPIGLIITALGFAAAVAVGVTEAFKDNRSEGEKLADEYENLSKKFTKTADEQKRLNDLNTKIVKGLKGVITETELLNLSLERRKGLLQDIRNLEGLSAAAAVKRLETQRKTTESAIKVIEDELRRRKGETQTQTQQTPGGPIVINPSTTNRRGIPTAEETQRRLFQQAAGAESTATLERKLDQAREALRINKELSAQYESQLETSKQGLKVDEDKSKKKKEQKKQITESTLALNDYEKNQLQINRDLEQALKFYTDTSKEAEALISEQLKISELRGKELKQLEMSYRTLPANARKEALQKVKAQQVENAERTKTIRAQKIQLELTRKELAERAKLVTTFRKIEENINRTNDGATGLLNTLTSIKDKAVGGIIQGVGQIGSALGAVWGKALEALGGLVGTVIAIGQAVWSLLDDTEEKKERARKQAELEEKIQQHIAEEIDRENQFREIGLRLQERKLSYLELELEAQKKLNDLFIENNLEKAKADLKAEKETFAKEGGGNLAKTGGLDLTTQQGQQAAIARRTKLAEEAAAIQDISDALANIDPKSLASRKRALEIIEPLAAKIEINKTAKAEIDKAVAALKSSIKEVVNLGAGGITFAQQGQTQVIDTGPELTFTLQGGGTSGTITTGGQQIVNAPQLVGGSNVGDAAQQAADIKALEDQLKKDAQNAINLGKQLDDNIKQANFSLTEFETLTTRGQEIIRAQQTVSRLEGEEKVRQLQDVIDDAQRKVQGEQLFKPGTAEEEVQQQQKVLGIEQGALADLVKGTSFTVAGLLTKEGFNKLVDELNKAEEGYQKAILELIKSQTETVFSAQEGLDSASDKLKAINDKLLELDPDRQVNILDIAVQSIRSAGAIIPTALNVKLPEAIDNIGTVLATAQKKGTDSQAEILLRSENHLIEIKSLIAILVELQKDKNANVPDVEQFIDSIITSIEDKRVA